MKSQEFCCLLLRWRCQVFEVYVLTWTLIEKVGKKCGWKKRDFLCSYSTNFYHQSQMKNLFGGHVWSFSFEKGILLHSVEKTEICCHHNETNVFTNEITKAIFPRKVFLMWVNFLLFHTAYWMLLFFNSMCVYPFFFLLKTFVDDALCWTKSLLRVVEIWHHWIVDKHGKTFSIPTIFPFVVGAMLSDVCRSICKTILY